jgi:hypothetical protein
MIILFLFLALFSVNILQSHILIVPYPYYNREYAINSTKYIAFNQLPIVCDGISKEIEKKWEFVWNGIGFYRIANRAYDVLANNRYLAAAFHGIAEFDLSDLSPNGKILYIKNNSDYYKNVLKNNEYIKYEGTVKPLYQLEEYGITFAADVIRRITDQTTFLCQLRLPVVNKTIYHDQNWRDIKYDNDFFCDDRLYLDPLNKYFRVRSDFLFENSIIPEIRSVRDFKQIKGVAFLMDNYDNYFLEKPCLFENDFCDQNELIDDINDNCDNEFNSNEKKGNKNKVDKKIIIDNWYAMTEFNEMAVPTKNSLLFYDQLIQLNKQLPENFLNAITRGEFLGQNYNWNTVKMNYIAPLDIQLNITKIFDYENIIVQGLCALVIPIKNNTFINVDNYISRSFFKDQYAFRLGSQMTYDINQYYKILLYGSWQYYFPLNQTIPAIFENVNAYGLSPLYLQGKVSWYEWYLSAHCVIKYTNYAGFDIGYQYIYKGGDTVIPECDNFYLINGERYKLDYTPWKKFSTSIANLLGINCYYYWDAFQFDIGIRGLIAGKNIIKLQECSLRVGLDF